MRHVPLQKILDAIPRLHETEDIPIEKKLIYLHFYIYGSDWFVCEYDGSDRFFGYAILNNDLINAEFGYFSMHELKSININYVEICCEPEWRIKTVSEVKKIKL